MKLRPNIICEICDRTFSSANISRHKRSVHSYCQSCKLLVSKKRHPCFRSGTIPIDCPPTPPKDKDQFVLVYVPVLIQKQLCEKLKADGSVWPQYDVEVKESLSEKVKAILKKDCLTCSLSEFIDVPDDRHSCTNPNREEFVSALRQCTDDLSDQTITNVYESAFGEVGGPPDRFVL